MSSKGTTAASVSAKGGATSMKGGATTAKGGASAKKKTGAGRNKGATNDEDALEQDGFALVDVDDSSTEESPIDEEKDIDDQAKLGECE